MLTFINKKKNKKIIKSNFLTNIFYINNIGKKRYTFVRIFKVYEDGFDAYNVINQNRKEYIEKINLIGEIYNPSVYDELYKKLLKHYKNGHMYLFLKENQTASIFLNNIDYVSSSSGEEMITFNKILFVNDNIYVVSNKDNKKINIENINYFNNGYIILTKYIDIYNYFNFQDYSYFQLDDKKLNKKDLMLSDDEKNLYFSFYRELNFFSKYQNCLNASRYFFINVNKLNNDEKLLIKPHLRMINLLNVHIEFFVLFKYFSTINGRKTNRNQLNLFFNFLQSIMPSLEINQQSFNYSFSLINTDYILNSNNFNGYLNFYILELLLNNLQSKYQDNEIKLFIKVINKIHNINDLNNFEKTFLSELNRYFLK